jgi:hypothetical protein
MARRGRPRVDRALEKACKDDSEHSKQIESIISRKLGTTPIRREADESLKREGSCQAVWESRIRCLRSTQWARAFDFAQTISDHELLERFFDDPALSTEERCHVARQTGLPKKAIQTLRATAWRDSVAATVRDDETERFLEDHARTERECAALLKRSVTPYVPSHDELIRLRKVRPSDSRTWPTLTDLKLATAISEKEIRRIIANSRPQTLEIAAPIRRRKQGALPKRFHPRLVLVVLEEFVKQLRDFPIKSAERTRFRQIGMTVKRALSSKLARS